MPKWVIKQQKQLSTLAIYLAQELLMNVQCNGGSRGFVKERRTLKIKECSDQPSEIDSDQLEPSSKLILLKLQEKLPKNSTSIIL